MCFLLLLFETELMVCSFFWALLSKHTRVMLHQGKEGGDDLHTLPVGRAGWCRPYTCRTVNKLGPAVLILSLRGGRHTDGCSLGREALAKKLSYEMLLSLSQQRLWHILLGALMQEKSSFSCNFLNHLSWLLHGCDLAPKWREMNYLTIKNRSLWRQLPRAQFFCPSRVPALQPSLWPSFYSITAFLCQLPLHPQPFSALPFRLCWERWTRGTQPEAEPQACNGIYFPVSLPCYHTE